MLEKFLMLSSLANAGTGTGGGGASGETLVAEETVLASGSVASGSVASGTAQFNRTETGLTLNDLRKWKIWCFRYVGADADNGISFYKSGTFDASLICNNKIANVVLCWLDTARTVLFVLDSAVGSGLLNLNNNVLRSGYNLGVNRQTLPAAINRIEVEECDIYFTSKKSLTGDVRWDIRGLVK